MSRFTSDLVTTAINDKLCMLLDDLIYESDLIGKVVVPAYFVTDFASVPRLPIIYSCWGNRAHREATLHDYLYRYDSDPIATRDVADSVFKEAMKATGKSAFIYRPMYWGVRIGSSPYFHKRSVKDRPLDFGAV